MENERINSSFKTSFLKEMTNDVVYFPLNGIVHR